MVQPSAEIRDRGVECWEHLPLLDRSSHSSILTWIKEANQCLRSNADAFPRDEIRRQFEALGFTEPYLTRLQSLRVGNPEEHLRDIVLFWLHYMGTYKGVNCSSYDPIANAIEEWFDCHSA